jgi:sugar transferase (PEP-CTERM/EpsH1 system associated)
MKRKVVHLVYSLGFGGLEQVIVNLINNSTEYNVQHCIITLTAEQDLYESIKPEVLIYNLNKNPGKDLSTHWKLYKLLKKLNADVIHSYNLGTIEYQLVAFLAGIKVRIHAEHGRVYNDRYGTNKAHNIFRRLFSTIITKFIVVSPDLYQWARAILKLNEDKLVLVYNGVDTRLYNRSDDKYERYTICMVGRLDSIKNQKMLIDSYIQIKTRYPDFKNTRVLLVGDGSLRQEISDQIESHNLSEEIIILGFRSDVSDILSKSNIFVLTSLYEAMPMTVIEAMACGVPVISTNVGGVGNVLTEDEGWLIELGANEELNDLLIETYRTPSLRNKKGKAGRELVIRNFSMDRMVESYMGLYKCDLIS